MIIVSDTTPLSELAKVGQLNLLKNIFGRVIIPEEVYNEVTAGKHPAATVVPSINWIEVRSVNDFQKVSELRNSTKLGWGECGAIILAEELNASRLLIDDSPARRIAESRNLPVIGTVGILLLAKQQGLISSVKEVLDDLRVKGKRISPSLYQQVLNAAR